MLLHMLDWPRPVKRAVVVLTDVTLALLATWMAYSIRMETLHWPQGAEWWTYAISPALAVPIFAAFGLYRAIFRYSGLASLYKTGQAIAVVAGALIAVHLWRLWPTFPLTLGVLLPIIFFALVATSRVAAQLWLTRYNHRGPIAQGRMLIYGAGAAGVQTSSAMAITRQFKLLGFVDDNPAKVGQTINGVPVYAPASLPTVVQSLLISDILLAMPSASRERRNTIIQGLRSLPVHTRTLPGLSDLASGRVTVQDFCELDVEDLLGREPVVPQADLINSSLRQLTILVTGAGGSIGSELCRQIVHEHPRRLLLLDHSEFALYTIHRELQGWCHTQDSSIELVPLLASVTNRTRLDWICTTYRPHTVYHAAAYKHVPMVECNPSEGMANNVFGTLNMAQAAQAAGVTRFVLVSTDKAVRPTNLMGASKRMAELVLQALAAQSSPAAATNGTAPATCFSMVRFGNVLGSSGSVVPMFREQILHGGPITVTHPEVTRYFMTIPEAVQLVLQAGAMGTGGDVFVLDMGAPVKIIDLARRLVALSGLQVRDADHPDGDIDIAVVGLRPGEKLYEELLIGDDPTPTAHPRIMKAHEDFMPLADLQLQLHALQHATAQEDQAAIRAVLHTCVHGFHEQAETPL
jgi:FlaA1/EpsC-like NDP-sugar epimerase